MLQVTNICAQANISELFRNELHTVWHVSQKNKFCWSIQAWNHFTSNISKYT